MPHRNQCQTTGNFTEEVVIMMTMQEIMKRALESLTETLERQRRACERHYGDSTYAEWRRKFMDTKAKAEWLRRTIETWGV